MKKHGLAIVGMVLGMAFGQNASADVDVGISIMIPGVVYPAPRIYYEPPPRHIHRPRVVVVQEPVYVSGPGWIWSDRDRHSRHWVPPGHRGKHWKKQERSHRDWDDD